MNEPTRDANIASMLALIKQGKSKRQICATLEISTDTFEDYQKEYLTGAVGRLTAEEGDFLLRKELKRCDDLEEKSENGIMKTEKKVQLLLQIATHRCKLLGLFPQQPLINLHAGGDQVPEANISFTIVGRRPVSLDELKAAGPQVIEGQRRLHQLPSAPEREAIPAAIEREVEPQIQVIPPTPVDDQCHGVDERGEWTRPLGPGFPKLYKLPATPAETHRQKQLREQEEANGGQLTLRGRKKPEDDLVF